MPLKKTSIIHVPGRFPGIQFHPCSKCSPINTKISPISDRKHVTDFYIMTVIKMAEVLKHQEIPLFTHKKADNNDHDTSNSASTVFGIAERSKRKLPVLIRLNVFIAYFYFI